MADSFFDWQLTPSFRDLAGRFTPADADLLEGVREEIRPLGQDFVELAREEAPRRSGAFAASLGFRTYVTGSGVGFRVHMARPLGGYIVEGTRAHVIRARLKRALWWEGARHPVVQVMHPGTKPNKFLGKAYRRWLPGARSALRDVGYRFVRTLVGKAKSGKV